MEIKGDKSQYVAIHLAFISPKNEAVSPFIGLPRKPGCNVVLRFVEILGFSAIWLKVCPIQENWPKKRTYVQVAMNICSYFLPNFNQITERTKLLWHVTDTPQEEIGENGLQLVFRTNQSFVYNRVSGLTSLNDYPYIKINIKKGTLF